MFQDVPDIEGFLFQEACGILQQAGYQIQVVSTGKPSIYRARVLRQRHVNTNIIELTQGLECYKDPGINENEA